MTLKTVKEHPILFSETMVKAILEGRKTQTRRIIMPQPPDGIDELHGGCLRLRAPYSLEDPESGVLCGYGFQDDDDRFYKCPYGRPGDRLWVRESCSIMSFGAGCAQVKFASGPPRIVSDSKLPNRLGKIPSIHMPRNVSRITLDVVKVRVERLHDITDEESVFEGCRDVASFRELWESIHGYGVWSDNPWLWVVDFLRYPRSA